MKFFYFFRKGDFLNLKKVTGIFMFCACCMFISPVTVHAEEVSTETALEIAENIEENTEESTQEITQNESTPKTTENKAVKEKKTTKKDMQTKVKKQQKKKNNKKTKKKIKRKINKKKLRLLSSLIYAESGNQCLAGQTAVGIVVMNRVKNPIFPNTIKGVIYQKNQFGPVRNGSLKRALNLYDKKQIPKKTIDAAKKALRGEKKVKYRKKTINCKNFHFFSTVVKNYKVQIQGHQFK